MWELYDECKGSENDNPAILPRDQQFIVLELANAGQDLESYQFNSAEQAHALFLQVRSDFEFSFNIFYFCIVSVARFEVYARKLTFCIFFCVSVKYVLGTGQFF